MSIINAIPCGTNTSDATATKNEIISGKTAYVKGQKLTGTLERVNALWKQCIADTGNGAINAGDFVSSINTKLNQELKESINDIGGDLMSSCLIDTNKILICYQGLDDIAGYAVVAYILEDRILYGSPYKFATKAKGICCCTIVPDLVLVTYINDASYGACKALEISGNTVLGNNEKIINTGLTRDISCCSIDGSYKIAITYVNRAIAASPAKITIVDTLFGNVTMLYSSQISIVKGDGITKLKCCNVEDNILSISYLQSDSPRIIVGKVSYLSGSTITMDYGPEMELPTDTGQCSSMYCSKIINNKQLITYIDYEDLKIVYLDIIDIYNVSFKYKTVVIGGLYQVHSCVLNSNNIIIACDTGFGSFGQLITISNNNIIVTDSKIEEYGQIYFTDCVRVNDSTGIMLFSLEPSLILITSTISNTVRKYVSVQNYPLFGVSRDSSNGSSKINVYTV